MKRLVVAALTVLGVAYLAFSPTPMAARTPGYVELKWMSAVTYNGQFCVTSGYGHGGAATAVDLVADDDGSICSAPTTSDGLQWVYVNTWGWADPTRKIASAYMVDGVYGDGCDYLEARVTGVDQKSRGTERYVHSRDAAASYWYDIWASPLGRTQSRNAGYTVADTNCTGGWTGHHVHQASASNCSRNGGLQAVRIYQTWNVLNHVHKYVWTEGQNC